MMNIYNLTIEDLDEPYSTVARELGIEAVYIMSAAFGGCQVYFPDLKYHCKEVIRQKIIDEFNGVNYKELAEKYHYTERHVRHILSEYGRKSPHKNQVKIEELL